MTPLTKLQRETLLRRLEREIVWADALPLRRREARDMAISLVDALSWTGVHGASEKRAVESIITKINEDRAS